MPQEVFPEMSFRSAVSLTPSPLVPIRLCRCLEVHEDTEPSVRNRSGPCGPDADQVSLDDVAGGS